MQIQTTNVPQQLSSVIFVWSGVGGQLLVSYYCGEKLKYFFVGIHFVRG